jgi:hypothetical protein
MGRRDRQRAIASFIIAAVKLIALLFLVALQCACTTSPYDQYNRRNLYSPEPEPGSPEAARQLQPHRLPTPEPKPQFRG